MFYWALHNLEFLLINAVFGCNLGRESMREIKNFPFPRESIIASKLYSLVWLTKENRKQNIEENDFFVWLNSES